MDNNLSQNTNFSQNVRNTFDHSFAIATVDAPWDLFVLKIKAYQYILKVTKFQLPSAYCSSKAEEDLTRWLILLASPSLFRARDNHA